MFRQIPPSCLSRLPFKIGFASIFHSRASHVTSFPLVTFLTFVFFLGAIALKEPYESALGSAKLLSLLEQIRTTPDGFSGVEHHPTTFYQ